MSIRPMSSDRMVQPRIFPEQFRHDLGQFFNHDSTIVIQPFNHRHSTIQPPKRPRSGFISIWIFFHFCKSSFCSYKIMVLEQFPTILKVLWSAQFWPKMFQKKSAIFSTFFDKIPRILTFAVFKLSTFGQSLWRSYKYDALSISSWVSFPEIESWAIPKRWPTWNLHHRPECEPWPASPRSMNRGKA